MDKPVKVLRILEYTYPNAEAAIEDQKHWQVQGDYSPRQGMTIRSRAFSMELLMVEQDD